MSQRPQTPARSEFCRQTAASPPFGAASNPDGPPGHILTVIANPASPIIVNLQFFAGCKTELPQWRLVLGDNPTALHVEQASAHFFSYTQEQDGRLTGGEVIAMRIADSQGA